MEPAEEYTSDRTCRGELQDLYRGLCLYIPAQVIRNNNRFFFLDHVDKKTGIYEGRKRCSSLQNLHAYHGEEGFLAIRDRNAMKVLVHP